MDNSQDGHYLLHLQTNKVVKCQILTKILITLSIIKPWTTFVPQGLKITNKSKNVIFNSSWIARADYDEEIVDNDKYYEEEDSTDDENNDANDCEYEKMDENELVDILQKSNQFQVPNEIEEEQEIFFEEVEDHSKEELFGDSEGYHEPEYLEDISLEADDKDGEEEDIKGRCQP